MKTVTLQSNILFVSIVAMICLLPVLLVHAESVSISQSVSVSSHSVSTYSNTDSVISAGGSSTVSVYVEKNGEILEDYTETKSGTGPESAITYEKTFKSNDGGSSDIEIRVNTASNDVVVDGIGLVQSGIEESGTDQGGVVAQDTIRNTSNQNASAVLGAGETAIASVEPVEPIKKFNSKEDTSLFVFIRKILAYVASLF